MRSPSALHKFVVLRIAEGHPVRQFGLYIDAQLVGGLESGIGRTPGMKAVMVDAVCLRNLKHAQPPVDVHGRIAGQAEIRRPRACRAGRWAGR